MARNGKLPVPDLAAGKELPGQIKEHASSLAQTVKDEVGTAVSVGGEKVREVGSALGALTETAKSRLPETRDRASSGLASAGQAAQGVGGQLEGIALAGAERARETGQRVTNDVIPSLRDLAMQAVAIAAERWESGRERVADAAESGTQVGQDAKARAIGLRATASDAAERAKPSAEEFLEVARRTADEIVERAKQAVGSAAEVAGAGVERADHAVEPIVERAKSAGQTAGKELRETSHKAAETGNDALGTVFWTAAAAGIVWYVLLGPERREQLERIARSVWVEGRELVGDLRGYDEEL